MAEAAKAEGNTAFKKQKYGAAAERYTEAIATAPRWHVPYVNRAQCYRKLAKWPQVEQDCRKALDLCSGLVKVRTTLGSVRTTLSSHLFITPSYIVVP